MRKFKSKFIVVLVLSVFLGVFQNCQDFSKSGSVGSGENNGGSRTGNGGGYTGADGIIDVQKFIKSNYDYILEVLNLDDYTSNSNACLFGMIEDLKGGRLQGWATNICPNLEEFTSFLDESSPVHVAIFVENFEVNQNFANFNSSTQKFCKDAPKPYIITRANVERRVSVDSNIEKQNIGFDVNLGNFVNSGTISGIKTYYMDASKIDNCSLTQELEFDTTGVQLVAIPNSNPDYSEIEIIPTAEICPNGTERATEGLMKGLCAVEQEVVDPASCVGLTPDPGYLYEYSDAIKDCVQVPVPVEPSSCAALTPDAGYIYEYNAGFGKCVQVAEPVDPSTCAAQGLTYNAFVQQCM